MNLYKMQRKKIQIIWLFLLALLSCNSSETVNEKLLRGIHERNWNLVITALEQGASPSTDYYIGTSSNNEPIYYTAFLAAIQYEAPTDVLEKFLENGADLQKRTISGYNALHLAGSNYDVVVWLLDHAEKPAGLLAARTEWGASPLHSAAGGNDPAVVQVYLDFGVDINLKDNNGRTPLMYASSSGSPQVIELLKTNGADLEATDNDGNTALYYAATRSKEENLEMLLDYGLSVNIPDVKGKTLLMTISQGTNADIAKILINAGARIDQVDLSGKSALIWACSEYSSWPPPPSGFSGGSLTDSGKKLYSDTIMVLIQNGARLDIRDNTGKTAFDYARENEDLTGTDAYWTLSDQSFQ